MGQQWVVRGFVAGSRGDERCARGYVKLMALVMIRRCTLWLGLVLLVQSGCDPSAKQPGMSQVFSPRRSSSADQRPMGKPDVNVAAARRDEAPRQASKAFPRILLKTQLDIMRVGVPFGAVSTSREIWALIDEQILPVSRVEHFHRNGLRVGLVGQASWPALQVTLNEIPEIEVTRQQLVLTNAFPLEVRLDLVPRLNTVFFYRDDWSMPGASYPDSKRYLHCAHWLSPDSLDEIVLGVTLEIRQEKMAMEPRLTPQGLRRVPIYGGKIYSEFSVMVTCPPGSVLVLGPSPAASEAGLLGGGVLHGAGRKPTAGDRLLSGSSCGENDDGTRLTA